MPSKSDVQAFYDRLHEERDRKAPEWMPDYWAEFDGRTLEVGAGKLVPQGVDLASYVAADFSSVACRKLSGQGVAVAAADAENLPFHDRAFDTVACHDVLEHVLAPQRVIEELCRVAGRKVVIAGPNYIGPNQGWSRWDYPERIVRFLLQQHRRPVSLVDPHLSFDDGWTKDSDAVSGVSVWWVNRVLAGQGFTDIRFGTFIGNDLANRTPVVRYLGFFMFVVACRG